MTQHITISVDPDVLERARKEAERQGSTIEQFVQRLLAASLPGEERAITGTVEDIFDLFPADAGPATDIARDKDKMIGEAVWQEHLRKTRQTP